MRIRGVVVDEKAQRVADAHITATRGDGGPCHITRSDSDGCFAFDIEPDDEDCTEIRARADGRASGTIYQRDDSPGSAALTIELAPTVALYGHVRDEEGKPVDGAIVATWGSVQTTTDASGGYRLDGVRPGKVHLSAWRNGLQLQTRTVLLGEETHLDWTLQPAIGRWIRFSLTKESPTDVRPTWSLWIHHPIHLHLEGTVPDSREVTLGGLPTDHQLQGAVWSTGLQADPINHYLEADGHEGPIEWRTHLAPASKANVAGTVVDEHDQPLPAIEVSLRGIGVVNDVTCKTGADGRFACEFERRPNDSLDDDLVFSLVDKERVIDDRDGHAWFNPRCRGYAYRPFAYEGEVVLRCVRSAGVRGRAVQGGHAIAGALVTLFVKWASQGRHHTSRLDSTDADDDGQFSFQGLHAAIGDGLFARVQAPGVDIVSDTFTLREGATIILPELSAEPLATVSGRLLDATGTALPACLLSLSEIEGYLDCWDAQGAETDVEGRFVIYNVRPGRYNIRVKTDLYEIDAPQPVMAKSLDVRAGENKSLGDLAL